MKRIFAALCAVFVLAGCESAEDFWTAETCGQRIEADIEDFDENEDQFRKAREGLEKAERSGKAEDAKAFRESTEGWKKNTETLLTFVDRDIAPVCKKFFTAAQLARIEAARKFVKEGAVITTHKEEGIPDVQVTKIDSVFIPYELDESGQCSGPYLDLTYTISNRGADYPRPVDLETYVVRAQRPPEDLVFFVVVGEVDFGNDQRKSVDFEVSGRSGGMLKTGGLLQLKKKIRVEYNQTSGKAWGYVQTTAFLKNGNDNPRYETAIDVPIWDIYTVSHMAIGSKDEDGKYYIGTKGTVTNIGKSPTPGPISASFMIYDATTEGGRYIVGWNGNTPGPVSGPTDIYAKNFSTLKLPPKIRVETSIIPLCPDGQAGSLADGDTKNNTRELKQAGGDSSQAPQ